MMDYGQEGRQLMTTSTDDIAINCDGDGAVDLDSGAT
jgi:membrane-bound lytic murein transglycosylase B